MDAPSALAALYSSQAATSSPSSSPDAKSSPFRVKSEPNAAVNSLLAASKAAALLSPVAEPTNSMISPMDGYDTPTQREIELQRRRYRLKQSSREVATGKRKQRQVEEEPSPLGRMATGRRKVSSDFLRKGQWTTTEEKLARLLIEAFDEGYLPIYTGIRLRGYLAVQLQCDPMRVSKKLCAGAIDGKQIPKNYGQKKFKLRKKPFWDCEEADRLITELEKLTRAMWSEARLKKPAFLTLSSTRNAGKRRGSLKGDMEMASSPPSPAKRGASSKTKRQKVFPIIYLNLSKKLRKYPMNALDDDSSDPASPSDSDSEPVKVDGESLQAAYDLLTLCRPDGSP